MYASPEGVPNFPPPQAITIYCLPPASNILGVAKPGTGKSVSHSNLPLRLLNARNFPSRVAAINNTPPAVTTEPP